MSTDATSRAFASLREGHTDARINAAHALARTRTVEAREALRAALSDAETIVCWHAWTGLLEQCGLGAMLGVRHSPLGVLTVQLYTNLPSVRSAAAVAAREILARIEAGESPRELGLEGTHPGDPPEVARFVASLDADRPAIDLDAVRALPVAHRAWAEAILVGALARQDPRAIRALVDLGATSAAPALRDAAARAYDPSFGDLARAAAESLDGAAGARQ